MSDGTSDQRSVARSPRRFQFHCLGLLDPIRYAALLIFGFIKAVDSQSADESAIRFQLQKEGFNLQNRSIDGVRYLKGCVYSKEFLFSEDNVSTF
jgi:hypothetical protein